MSDLLTDEQSKIRDIYEHGSRTELMTLRNEIQYKADAIKSQIEKAKRAEELSDPDWFQRAGEALRAASRQVQTLNTRMAIVRNEEKQKNIKRASSVHEAFIEVARRRLDDELFWEIMHEAEEETT